jgi:lipopolysaccharide export system permease protein
MLQNVMALYFDGEDNFRRRIDSQTARLENGMWMFEQAISNTPRGQPEAIPLVVLPTDLTVKDIEESFGSPETLSFWAMPGFIRTLEATGFDATRLKIHFHSLLAQPLLFAAMILIGAAVSLRPPRFRGGFMLVTGGVVTGFVVFFMASFLEALGASHQIPVILAAWAPALVTFLIGVAVMMSLEDG